MCEVLDVIEARGKEAGRAEGRLKMLLELAADGLLTPAEVAKRVNLTETEFIQMLKNYEADT